MDEQYYSLEDFVADEYFQRWVLQPDAELDRYWENWLLAHPNQRKTAEEAREFIQLLKFRNYQPSSAEQTEVWSKIQATETEVVPLYSWRKAYLAAAAVLFLLVALGGWYYTQYLKPTTVSTSFGQTQLVYLPDSSLVQLNANSSLRYRRSWFGGYNREVWLVGEGFFQVRKQQHPTGLVKFIVHTEQLDVEVLGTQFNVNTRRQETKVVLAEGKVRLRGEEAKEIVMQPGELARLKEGEAQINTQVVDPNLYASWRENKVVFNQVSLREVARSLEDYFGYQVTFADTSLATKVFKGTLPVDNAEVWLATLERSFPLTIDVRKKRVTFGIPHSF